MLLSLPTKTLPWTPVKITVLSPEREKIVAVQDGAPHYRPPLSQSSLSCLAGESCSVIPTIRTLGKSYPILSILSYLNQPFLFYFLLSAIITNFLLIFPRRLLSSPSFSIFPPTRTSLLITHRRRAFHPTTPETFLHSLAHKFFFASELHPSTRRLNSSFRLLRAFDIAAKFNGTSLLSPMTVRR